MRFPRGARVRLRRQVQRDDGLVFPADTQGVVAWGGWSWRCVEFRLPYRDTAGAESIVVRADNLVDDRQLRLPLFIGDEDAT